MKGSKVAAPHKRRPSVVPMSPPGVRRALPLSLSAAGRGAAAAGGHARTCQTETPAADVSAVPQRAANVSRRSFLLDGNNAALVAPCHKSPLGDYL